MMLGGVGGARAMIPVARTGVVIGTILTRAERALEQSAKHPLG